MIIITADQAGQRIDNFLFTFFKKVPKTRIYRALRSGEVRVNKGRIKPDYRLQEADQIRVPPFSMDADQSISAIPSRLSQVEQSILLENDDLILMNKPAGLAVHGGSGLNGGLIELLRILRPEQRFLELVHRLDRETSGCLLVAKKRKILLKWHLLLTQRRVHKQYLALVKGHWIGGQQKVDAPLLKNRLSSGERIVVVDETGKAATTLFKPLCFYKDATLVEAKPITGRTHQIRVHAAHIGYPIVGDNKYGDSSLNKQFKQKIGLKRLFLHAASINCYGSETEYPIAICALLDKDLRDCLRKLKSA